jgi:hypothetical protein
MKENAIDSIACVSFALSHGLGRYGRKAQHGDGDGQSETSMVGRSSLTNGYGRLDAFAT